MFSIVHAFYPHHCPNAKPPYTKNGPLYKGPFFVNLRRGANAKTPPFGGVFATYVVAVSERVRPKVAS